MTYMEKEIFFQKEVLNKTFNNNVDKVKELAKIINNYNPSEIVIVARGSSRNAAEYFKYVLEIYAKIRVSFAYPSITTLFNSLPTSGKPIYLAVSQGGKGEDVRIIMEKAKENGFLTVSITNEENNPLTKICDYNLYLYVEKELSMAATKTFTSEMLVLGMLAFAISNKDVNEFNKVTDIVSKALDKANDVKEISNMFYHIKSMYVLARGYSYAIAKEACCKLQETCFINANGYATSDFMHGPFALVDEDSFIVLLHSNDKTSDDIYTMNEKVLDQGATVVSFNIETKEEYLVPFENIIYVQLFALYISQAKGTNPDESRNLSKYTITK